MVPDICFSLCGLLALVWKQRRAFHHHTSRYVIVVTLADLRPVPPITGRHLATTPPPSALPPAGILASLASIGDVSVP